MRKKAAHFPAPPIKNIPPPQALPRGRPQALSGAASRPQRWATPLPEPGPPPFWATKKPRIAQGFDDGLRPDFSSGLSAGDCRDIFRGEAESLHELRQIGGEAEVVGAHEL